MSEKSGIEIDKIGLANNIIEKNNLNILELRKKIFEEAQKVVILPQDRNAEGKLLVFPDGPQSHLDEQQWRIVRTLSFKKWFGDWSKFDRTQPLEQSGLGQDDQETSKIVDENEEPFLVYHETNNDFEIHDDSRIGSLNDAGYYGAGHYFSTNEGIPGGYARKGGGKEHIVMNGFLNIKRPYYFDEEDYYKHFYKELLNRKPKDEAIKAAKKYIDIEIYERNLRDLEAGIIDKHRDIPQGVDFDKYWEDRRLSEIDRNKKIISKWQKIIADLSRIYDDINKMYDGVIVMRKGQLTYDRYEEIIAFRFDQILNTQKLKL